MEGSELKFDFSKTALIVLDLQPSVVAKPTVPNDPMMIVVRAARLAKEFRDAGAKIVFVTYSPDESARMPLTGMARKQGVIGQGKEDPVRELGISNNDIRIRKRGYDAFFGTGLHDILSGLKINTLVLCGISTESSVESTARTGREHGYTQVIASDATSGKTFDAYYGSWTFFNKWCLIRTTEQISSAIRESRKGMDTKKRLKSQ